MQLTEGDDEWEGFVLCMTDGGSCWVNGRMYEVMHFLKNEADLVLCTNSQTEVT